MSSPLAKKQGSALLLALVTIVILSTLMVSFMFRIHLESDLAAQTRFGFKAQHLAKGGQEYAKWMLTQSVLLDREKMEAMGDAHVLAIEQLHSGLPLLNYPVETEEGICSLSIWPESSWRNVNLMSDADWEQMFKSTGVPEEFHADLIAQFRDWTDADESALLLGAESDDIFYQNLELPVKNARLSALEELQMIKGFTAAICFGGTLEEFYNEPDIVVTGIVPLLSVYGNNQINLLSAPRDVLMTLSGIREDQVDKLIQGRWGPDGLAGTEDDGFENLTQALGIAGLPPGLEATFSFKDYTRVRIYSVGQVGQVRKGIEAIYELSGKRFILLSYREFGF